MEQITLTGSFVQYFNQNPYTFFIGQQDGYYGIISAGSWDTVLPFCFDEIHAYPDDILCVSCNGENRLLHLVREKNGIRAVPISSACNDGRRAICLPA